MLRGWQAFASVLLLGALPAAAVGLPAPDFPGDPVVDAGFVRVDAPAVDEASPDWEAGDAPTLGDDAITVHSPGRVAVTVDLSGTPLAFPLATSVGFNQDSGVVRHGAVPLAELLLGSIYQATGAEPIVAAQDAGKGVRVSLVPNAGGPSFLLLYPPGVDAERADLLGPRFESTDWIADTVDHAQSKCYGPSEATCLDPPGHPIGDAWRDVAPELRVHAKSPAMEASIAETRAFLSSQSTVGSAKATDSTPAVGLLPVREIPSAEPLAALPRSTADPVPAGSGDRALPVGGSVVASVPRVVPASDSPLASGALGASTAAAAALLLWRFALLLGSRLAAWKDADGHPLRRSFVEYLGRHPGATAADIARAHNVHYTTADYHLRVLESARLVSSARSGLRKRFFAGATGSERLRVAAALASPSAFAFARLLNDRPGLAQQEVAIALGMTPAGVSWHATRLKAEGVLSVAREGRRIRLFLTSQAATVVREAAASTPSGS